ncbi:MAG: ZIP family metal transporter [Thiobacillus sp.]|jgi:ZIP family zinc transporter|uniref:ZIP family metal transporter n=1 Tax=Thiobacillus sp. TaxID=924 RepID=UPI00289451F4|nr:ZIP family metal transporter [Thiobacillus sp.]MDT3705590.1 ZIP family metal transporter [Thiobacillus sp.]
MNTAVRTLQDFFSDPRRAHAARLGSGLLFVVVLGALVWVAVAQGGTRIGTPMGQALAGSGIAALATALGALPALFIRRISPRSEDVMLGFGAGVMAAASCFSLILPGVVAGTDILGSKPAGASLVALGLVLGAAFLLLADKVVPHEHPSAGRHGPDWVHLRSVWLMVFAICLHNLPEGMAIGVGFSAGDTSVGIPLAAAIALQDIPEGLVVAVALRTVAYAPWQAAAAGALSGLAEPLGAILGVAVTASFAPLYPAGLGFAAGAMIWVVSHEIIPETHRKGHEQAATLGVIGGFVVMMMLDTVLG